ncbi:MAG TPA: hypothetical protein VJP81_08045 [Candidatus Dormibacteraeota bacterium]|nr:hypothetical protein [Candidatus Dormibacteraeota bacterium]
MIWFGVTDCPDTAWVAQQARNVIGELNQIGVKARFGRHLERFLSEWLEHSTWLGPIADSICALRLRAPILS